jgi:hypothetical protein
MAKAFTISLFENIPVLVRDSGTCVGRFGDRNDPDEDLFIVVHRKIV